MQLCLLRGHDVCVCQSDPKVTVLFQTSSARPTDPLRIPIQEYRRISTAEGYIAIKWRRLPRHGVSSGGLLLWMLAELASIGA